MGIHSRSSHRVSEAAAIYATANLSDALFTTTQQRVLAQLFGYVDRTATVTELIQATGAGSGAVQRELARLAGSGLLLVEQLGNQKRYRPNPDSLIHDEIASIVRKTFGLADPLRIALAPFAAQIDAAFVYGSVAKRADAAHSDIDLLIVSDTLAYADVMLALDTTIQRLGRDINPTIYTCGDWHERLANGNSFAVRVMEQPKLWLIGSDDDLRA